MIATRDILERTLPHSLDAERAVLGAILLHNGTYDRAARHISAASFYRDAHRRIFASLARLIDRPSGAADLPLLRDDLARCGDLDECGGPAYLSALVDGLPRATNIEHYAAVVKDKALLRECIYLGNKITAAAYEGEEPAATVIAAADQAIVALQHGAKADQMRSLAASQGELLDDLEHRIKHKGELSGVTTGFQSLNEMTLGWQAGDLIVLAARPSIGKTSLVLNSAFAGAEALRPDGSRRHVAIFSLEMRRSQLEYRIVASLTNIDLSRLLGGYVRDNEWPKITEALERMHAADLYIDDTASRTVSDIRGTCRRLASEHRLDLVVIDYVQLMTGPRERKGTTRTEEIAHISRALKVLAGELAVPIILLSQLNRSAASRTDPRPQLSDLRDSGALEQDADIVLFLHRKHHRESGTTQAIIEKGRNIATGSVNLTICRETCLFTDGGDDPPPPSAEEQAESKKRAFVRRAHSQK